MSSADANDVPPSSEKSRLMWLSDISMSIGRYGDIFSDFDPRPYSQRAISDDFLHEAKRAVRYMASGSVELKLLMPKNKRDRRKEGMIKKRLRAHFKRHAEFLMKEKTGIMRNGAAFCAAGVVLMFVAAYLLFSGGDRQLISYFFIILMEPGGWFLFWEGLNLIIFEPKKQKHELRFYNKMSRCSIQFISY